MSLEAKSMKELLELHNSLAPKPAGPKTFSTKAKLLDRIRALQAAQAATTKAPKGTEKAKAPRTKKGAPAKNGRGVGDLARGLLMDERGLPCALIADLVNREIKGATCSANSVRWYAAQMRKRGVDVPARAEKFAAQMDEEESSAWLASVRVVSRGGEVRSSK